MGNKKPDLTEEFAKLLKQMEAQQRVISELRVKLNTTEEKAVELDNRVFQMRTLLQSGKGFSQILNLSNLLDTFMAVCRERYASINSCVLLRDDLSPNETSFRVRRYHGIPHTYTPRDGEEEELYLFKLPHDRGLLWQLIHQGDVFAVRDMRKLPRFESAFKKWNLGVLQSDVWVPLIRGTDVLGILTLGECVDGTQIPETDYSFLEEIAAVAATNIDSTLKYEKNNRILKNLQTLYDVNQQLTNVNDFKELVDETLKTAVNALEGQKANLMLLNRETRKLEIKVVHGAIPKSTIMDINEGTLETRTFKIGEGVSGQAALLEKPVRLNDRSKIEQIGDYPVFCILAAPIIYGKELEGVLTITNKVKKEGNAITVDTLGRFGEDDEQLLLSLADQAALNLHKARLYNTSITDRLTGLYNSRHFETKLNESLSKAKEQQTSVCLAIADIDHFKKFNDRHGHRAGDLVLSNTSNIMKTSMPRAFKDLCFRYGGEEFCIIFPQTELEQTIDIVNTFRQNVENAEYSWEGQNLKCTISLGIACSTDFAEPSTLFEAADQALYSSKLAGRNRTTYISESGTTTVDSLTKGSSHT